METQNYGNHVHRPAAWAAGVLLSLLALLLLIWSAVRAFSLQAVALVVLSLALVVAFVVARLFALRLQDRIIRLEMQVRLSHLGRGGDMTRLSLRQLIALRFASDAELPGLIDRALTENLTPDQIKRAIAAWQGDFLRT